MDFGALPSELEEIRLEVEGYARTKGLDYPDVRFVMLDFNQMNQVAAYKTAHDKKSVELMTDQAKLTTDEAAEVEASKKWWAEKGGWASTQLINLLLSGGGWTLVLKEVALVLAPALSIFVTDVMPSKLTEVALSSPKSVTAIEPREVN